MDHGHKLDKEKRKSKEGKLKAPRSKKDKRRIDDADLVTVKDDESKTQLTSNKAAPVDVVVKVRTDQRGRQRRREGHDRMDDGAHRNIPEKIIDQSKSTQSAPSVSGVPNVQTISRFYSPSARAEEQESLVQVCYLFLP